MVWSRSDGSDGAREGEGAEGGSEEGRNRKEVTTQNTSQQQYGLFPVFTILMAFFLCGFVRCGEIFPFHFIVLLLPKSCRVSKFSVDACFVRFSNNVVSSSCVYIQRRAMTAAWSVFHARSCLLLHVCCQKERNIRG